MAGVLAASALALHAPLRIAICALLAGGAAAALVVAVMRAVEHDRRRFAAAAVADERRRIARELHDGLAQELAFIAATARGVADGGSRRRAELLEGAAQRALDDSRSIIGALRASKLPLGASLARQADEFASRWGLRVNLDVPDELDASPEQEHAVLRIVGEALANAARHGRASSVDIRLGDDEGGLRVTIQDDGCGFVADESGRAATGFGLQGMRERAESVGGALLLESRPGHGTRVELALS
jgi:signal transduction histidine kinase